MGWLKLLKDPAFLLREVNPAAESLNSKRFSESWSKKSLSVFIPSLGDSSSSISKTKIKTKRGRRGEIVITVV